MHFTKTEIGILKEFASKITESFTIREIAKRLKQNYSIVYSAVQNLHKNSFLIKDRHKNFSLNKKNYQNLAYIEQLRAEEFLKKNKEIAIFVEDAIEKANLGFFSLLLFGSYAEGKQRKRSDIDILMIIENLEDTEKTERWLQQISERHGNFHCSVISKESVKEMAAQKEKLNVINETLNKHIIFFGAGDYYRLIS